LIDPIAIGTAIATAAATSPAAANLGVLLTGFFLGVRHGIDWDHIAAITDITSTTASAAVADAAHAEQHRSVSGHAHAHGGEREIRAHDAGPGGATLAPALALRAPVGRPSLLRGQSEAIRLGTLYALGHGLIVVVLGLAAIAFGALLPDWLDPIMGRIVGVTLVALGLWVIYSIYRYARAGERFRLRSRWMLVFDGMRYGWRRFQAKLHGHEHVDPLEMSSYGARTSFGVGMIHGIGAETGSQVLLIAAVGGASSAGLGVPMLFAFVIGLLISNLGIVLISSVSFVSSQARERLYVAVGAVAGVFSLVIGAIFLFGLEGSLPDLGALLPF
jgi:high-affinity nickel-transport protein